MTSYYKRLLDKFDTHIVSTKSLLRGNHYTAHAKEFFEFLLDREIMSLKKVDAQTTKAYFHYLTQRPKKRGEGTLSDRSVNDHLSTLRMLSKRMQQEDIISRGIPVPVNIKLERDTDNYFLLTREILSTDEVRIVYESCKTDFERALIALAYGCGLRRNALEKLEEFQINYSHGLVTALKAKNNKTREIPISDFFLKVLKDYSVYRLKLLSSLGIREKRFFVNEKGKALSGSTLNDRLKKILARTDNQAILDKNITLHCLRHSIATHLIDAGHSFEYVRVFLGHSIADTSLIYAKRRKTKNYYAI